MSDGLPERKDVKAALRAIGLSNRQVRALLERGWRGLVDETAAENAELLDRIEELRGAFRDDRV
jgi:hypothetical protein